MGVYERSVCPWLTERMLSNRWVDRHRKALLAPLRGRVLELGFGTGLNLPCYPTELEALDVVDPAVGMHRRAQARVADSAVSVRTHVLSAETLPFDDDTFQAVVSTFTLCTIPDVERAISEVRRVLVPEGRFFVFEHVASESDRIRAWQTRLNPIQKLLGCGCHLDRDVTALLTGGGFATNDLERIIQPKTPALVREHLIGSAAVA